MPANQSKPRHVAHQCGHMYIVEQFKSDKCSFQKASELCSAKLTRNAVIRLRRRVRVKRHLSTALQCSCRLRVRRISCCYKQHEVQDALENIVLLAYSNRGLGEFLQSNIMLLESDVVTSDNHLPLHPFTTYVSLDETFTRFSVPSHDTRQHAPGFNQQHQNLLQHFCLVCFAASCKSLVRAAKSSGTSTYLFTIPDGRVLAATRYCTEGNERHAREGGIIMIIPRRRSNSSVRQSSRQQESQSGLAAEVTIFDYLNLSGLRVISQPEENEFSLWIKAEQFPKLESCPVCGSDYEQFTRNGTRPRIVRDVPRGLQSVYVEILRQSYYCAQCQKLFRHPLSSVSDSRRMTTRLVSHIEKLSLLRPAREVSLLTGASTGTIREIMTRYRQHLDKTVRFETPRVLGIDGVFARVKDETGKSRKRECAMFTDIEAGLRIDLRPGITIKEVSKRLRAFLHSKRIKIVVIDMSPALLAAIREALPDAIIVVDLFHIQSKINEGLDKVRIRLRKGAARRKGQLTMCRKELLRKRRDQLKPNEEKELKLWFELKPELGLAYEVVEGCLKIWHSSSSKTAQERYQSWLKQFPPELRKDFHELLSAFKNWGEYIFNYFDHRYTNAFTESSNRIVKDILRETRGCDFETLRGKVIYGTWIKKQMEEARLEEMKRKKRKPKKQDKPARRRRRRRSTRAETEPPIERDVETEGIPPPAIQMDLF